MENSKGWIKTYRDIQDHWLWSEKPFDKRSAWLDLILSANHKNKKFPLGTEIMEVKRGDFVTSELKLAARWGWSKTKTRNFLKLLENDNMIVKKADRKKTTISIVNYSKYQDTKTTEKLQENHCETTAKPLQDTNKNVKNNNTIITIGEADIYKYFEQNMGQLVSPIIIEKLNSYIDILGEELVRLAIDKSVENNKRSYAYIETILKSWLSNGYKTKQQIIDADIKRKEEQEKRYSNSKNKSTKQSKFINYEQRTYDFEAIEMKAMNMVNGREG
ncbi:MAG: DnaD domain protein [Vallitalea sp.]|jgi:DnaD/phage-associated family protein|nr:DnaD domain protein [Vallitalea sp.]